MKISNAVVGASFVVAGAVVYAATLGYPSLNDGHPGPAVFPRILTVSLALVLGPSLSTSWWSTWAFSSPSSSLAPSPDSLEG